MLKVLEDLSRIEGLNLVGQKRVKSPIIGYQLQFYEETFDELIRLQIRSFSKSRKTGFGLTWNSFFKETGNGEKDIVRFINISGANIIILVVVFFQVLQRCHSLQFWVYFYFRELWKLAANLEHASEIF